MALLNWTLYYFLPAAITFYITRQFNTLKARFIAMHTGLLASVLLITFSGINLNFSFGISTIFCFVLSVLVAIYFLKKFSLAYIFSSILQEICFLLAATLIIQGIGLIWGSILTTTIFSLEHSTNIQNSQTKLLITFSWGVTSILIYYYFQQPLINFSIHILGGSILIKQGFLYKTHKKELYLK